MSARLRAAGARPVAAGDGEPGASVFLGLRGCCVGSAAGAGAGDHGGGRIAGRQRAGVTSAPALPWRTTIRPTWIDELIADIRAARARPDYVPPPSDLVIVEMTWERWNSLPAWLRKEIEAVGTDSRRIPGGLRFTSKKGRVRDWTERWERVQRGAA